MREDHIGLQGHQFFCKRLKLFCPASREATVDADITALRPSAPFEPLPECREARLRFWIVFGIAHQHGDAPHAIGLLRARTERPHGRRTTEKLDEFAPLHL